jgi:adenine-specific DNA-methyltransferase
MDPGTRSELGQFLTPPAVASIMAAFFGPLPPAIRLLDAGAGVGSLFSAFVAEASRRGPLPDFQIVAYELDPRLARYARATAETCRTEVERGGASFSAEVIESDFIEQAVSQIDPGLFGSRDRPRFTHAILNPPYRKLNSDSPARLLLRRTGIETSNLYAAFLALAIQLLDDGGELVAITPRSFCNGPYFRPFREFFLRNMNLSRIHVFESRQAAFSDDEVLQENVIFRATKGPQEAKVMVSSGHGPDDEGLIVREADFDDVVRSGDPQRFIHVVSDNLGEDIAVAYSSLSDSLTDLHIEISTGRVVDFRAKRFLRKDPDEQTGPLVYPTHLRDGVVCWPKAGKKPNALVDSPSTSDLWFPSGVYVLVKRFSAKEERRRVVAAVFDPAHAPGPKVAFENHLNVFHAGGRGLDSMLAVGLAVFLNSTLVDSYFRQFNGHTQVNATDLRSLRYPPTTVLRALGGRTQGRSLSQDEIDDLVEEMAMANSRKGGTAIRALKRIQEALEVLKALGLPTKQQNERSALTLLALLDVRPLTKWAQASAPLMGITPMMSFFADHYGRTYAPNSRETVRRETVHQFVQAGFVRLNPDKPERPVNSPKAVYQIEASALDLLRKFGGGGWDDALPEYLDSAGMLAAAYAHERTMTRIPVTLPAGQKMSLTAGGQNALIKSIVEQFCPRFTPGGGLIYVGDAGDKWSLFDRDALTRLGVTVDSHGKMPDVVIHHSTLGWLVLVEAVTSHGPVNPKRRTELAELFKSSRAGLVYVTAFLSRKAMVKYLGDISWETEVWVADAPDHMIHFNGERFLGPY